MKLGRNRRRIAAGTCLCLLACAGSSQMYRPGPPVVAVLPFESLAGGVENAKVITVLCQNILSNLDEVELLDPGLVEDALATNRIRQPSLMTENQRQALSGAIGADVALVGSVLTYGAAQHPYAGKIGVVAFTARVIDLQDGAILWADTRSRQGSDGQWLFGFGSKHDPAIIAEEMCVDLLGDIPWDKLLRVR